MKNPLSFRPSRYGSLCRPRHFNVTIIFRVFVYLTDGLEGQQAVQVVFQIFQVGDNGASVRVLTANEDFINKLSSPVLGFFHGISPYQGQGQVGVIFTGNPVFPVRRDMGIDG